MSVHVSTHPLVRHKLTLLRDRTTDPTVFRQLVRELSAFLLYEATRNMTLTPCTVATPLADYAGSTITQKIGLIPILRAGLGMVDPILELLPMARVWHLGLYRDHETLEPVTYYNKMAAQPDLELALLLDPMLATGGSAVAAVNILKRGGLRHISFLGMIAAPEGVEMMQSRHPDVPLYLGDIDSHLNEKGYIVPGLGDAGDRQFATT
jgi:uracil phosphoribosyltransferase